MQYKIERANTTTPRLYRVMLGCIPMSPAMTKKQCEDWRDMQQDFAGSGSMSNGYKSGGFINNALLKG